MKLRCEHGRRIILLGNKAVHRNGDGTRCDRAVSIGGEPVQSAADLVRRTNHRLGFELRPPQALKGS